MFVPPLQMDAMPQSAAVCLLYHPRLINCVIRSVLGDLSFWWYWKLLLSLISLQGLDKTEDLCDTNCLLERAGHCPHYQEEQTLPTYSWVHVQCGFQPFWEVCTIKHSTPVYHYWLILVLSTFLYTSIVNIHKLLWKV